jgi:hypothetical protein
MSRLLSSLTMCIATLVACVGSEATEPPINIGSRLELLVDDALIDKLDGVAFKLHPPRPAEVALRFDKPWEGSGNHYLTVFKDDDGYHMYYHSVVGRSNSASGEDWVSYTCYAQSEDGVKWIRPNLGLHDFKGSKNNNIVYPGPFGFEEGALLFPYPNQKPDAPPGQRYLAPGARVKKTANGTEIRLFLFASPDRVRWSQVGDKAIINGLGTEKPSTYYSPENLLDSDHSLFWDVPSQQYFLYLRDQRVQATTAERLRAVRRATSKDLIHWSYPEWTHMDPSPPDQFYTFGARPYFREPHYYLAFPMRYVRWRKAPLPGKYKKQLGVGVSDTVFVSSRDGLHWDRRFLDAFIRPGLDPLKWTDRSNHTSMGLVPTGPNEMSVYMLEYFRLPEPRVRRYVMRTDGVASINAPYTGGQFTTQPLVFSGNRLLINASTSAAGAIRVEILDADGRNVDRFTGDNVVEFFGDTVEQEVRWDQGPDVGPLAGKPVRLRFVMKDADLYSFRFSDMDVPSARAPSGAGEN